MFKVWLYSLPATALIGLAAVWLADMPWRTAAALMWLIAAAVNLLALDMSKHKAWRRMSAGAVAMAAVPLIGGFASVGIVCAAALFGAVFALCGRILCEYLVTALL